MVSLFVCALAAGGSGRGCRRSLRWSVSGESPAACSEQGLWQRLFPFGETWSREMLHPRPLFEIAERMRRSNEHPDASVLISFLRVLLFVHYRRRLNCSSL